MPSPMQRLHDIVPEWPVYVYDIGEELVV
jgi:hypothetical protein